MCDVDFEALEWQKPFSLIMVLFLYPFPVKGMKAWKMKKWCVFFLCCWSLAAARASDMRFTVVSVDVQKEHLAIFLNDPAGRPFHTFKALHTTLKAQHKELRFAVNAGMFHANFAPVGLLIENAQLQAPLNLATGPGNFFMKPNGVFLVHATGAQVVESSEYASLPQKETVRLATQSGPLLVHQGHIHPVFQKNSTARKMRNGVGVCGQLVKFVISEQPVNFYTLAAYFRDELKCDNALYLDGGTASSLYSKTLGRDDFHTKLGPILGVVD
jgi:uncharacterized protein YigE (DUF2233 family)